MEKSKKKCKRQEGRGDKRDSNQTNFLTEDEFVDLVVQSELRCVITRKRTYIYEGSKCYYWTLTMDHKDPLRGINDNDDTWASSNL